MNLNFIKKKQSKSFDKRYGEEMYTATFFIFEAKYEIGNDVQILVNSELFF